MHDNQTLRVLGLAYLHSHHPCLEFIFLHFTSQKLPMHNIDCITPVVLACCPLCGSNSLDWFKIGFFLCSLRSVPAISTEHSRRGYDSTGLSSVLFTKITIPSVDQHINDVGLALFYIRHSAGSRLAWVNPRSVNENSIRLHINQQINRICAAVIGWGYRVKMAWISGWQGQDVAAKRVFKLQTWCFSTEKPLFEWHFSS
jgi:hypothetical protein